MEPSLTSAFTEYGAMGLLALVEMGAIIALWRKLNISQEARIEEAKGVVKIIEQVRDSLDRLTDSFEKRGRLP